MPKAEALLWIQLSRKQVKGYKFRRQYGIGSYVLDFYCPKLKLAIEVDGESHFVKGAEEYDRERQHSIEGVGITFLRFLNTDIYENMNGVIQTIVEKIEEMNSTIKNNNKATSP